MEWGHWMIQDHYLAVKRWSLSFNPREPCFDHTMVWIRFSSLNMMYYEKNSIKATVAVVGKPIKVNLQPRGWKGVDTPWRE